jgi:hypothetical protein
MSLQYESTGFSLYDLSQFHLSFYKTCRKTIRFFKACFFLVFLALWYKSNALCICDRKIDFTLMLKFFLYYY